MESGEMLTKEEHTKRKTERDQAQLDGINEDDEAEDEAPASKKWYISESERALESSRG